MERQDGEMLETILRGCAAAAPNPWYPSTFSQTAGMPREALDPFLDQLRMAGLVRLTDWVQGTGQGYALTPAGDQVLNAPRLLARLRLGDVPAVDNVAPPEAERAMRAIDPLSRGEAARTALLNPINPWATVLLILVNVVWFLAGLGLAVQKNVPLNQYLSFRSDPEILHDIGAIRGEDIYIRHEWFRLLTCCFVHVGLVHLGVNMFSLYAVGPLLEQLWGSWRFLVLYLIAGFGGSCGMVIEQPLAGGAGASGALWGVLGSMATWLFLNRQVLPGPLVAMWRRQLILVFVINLALTFGIAQISKGAHLGGGLVGMIAAVPMDYLRFGTPAQRQVALATLCLIPVLCVAALVQSFRSSGAEIERLYHRRHSELHFRMNPAPPELGLSKAPQA
jgi:membrane associated rhomboid family serine protease